MTDHHLVNLAIATTLGVLAVGRATRLVVHDDWPPIAKIRMWWVAHTTDWSPLMTCPFCLSPWLTLVDLGWATWARVDINTTGWAAVWWFTNAWFALAYLAAMVVVRDEGE